jgi:tetratricopeptide (TPR) repeat protein
MMPAPSQPFIQLLTNGLNHWLVVTHELDDEGIKQVDGEWRNLFAMVEYGLRLRQTWSLAVDVILQSIYLIERRSYWHAWLPLFQKAVKRAPDDAQKRQHQLFTRLGELYRYTYQLDKAIACHQQAETIAQQLNDAHAIAEAQFGLAFDYVDLRQNYAEAEQKGLAALEAFTSLQAKGGWIANSYRLLGNVARLRGDLDLAVERLSQAVTLGRQLQQPTRLARMLIGLANAFTDTKQYDEARSCLDEAAQVLTTTMSEIDKSNVQYGIGIIYWRQEKWDKAETAFQKSFSPYLRQINDLGQQANLINNLGNVYLKQHRLTEAEAQLRHARSLWQQLQAPLNLANTIGTLAEVLVQQGKEEEAALLFEQAIKLLHDYPDDAWAKNLLSGFQEQLDNLQ